MWNDILAVEPSSSRNARRILRARKLHENAVAADALDCRLGDAHLVDALADDFEALLDGVIDVGANAGRREGQRDRSTVRRNHKIRLAGGDPDADCIGERLQFGHGRIALRRIGHDNDDLVLVLNDGLGVDVLGAQDAARIPHERLQPLMGEVAFIDFEHEMGAAAKVEAEGDLGVGKPRRYLCQRGLRQNIR